MKKILGFSFFILISYVWIACEKPPIYDNTPHIEWVGFSVDTVQQMSGVVAFTFSFTDGDGDLGNTDSSSIYIIDTRRSPNDTFFYQIPPIEQQGIESGISGEIEVTMSQLCCINPSFPLILCQPIQSYYDPITFKIQIIDNAGRHSNLIETTPLYVKCF